MTQRVILGRVTQRVIRLPKSHRLCYDTDDLNVIHIKQEASMTTVEEIEVNVRQIDEKPPVNPSVQVFEIVRKLILAGIGAFALSREEAEAFLNRLVERGELAQKDAQKLFEEAMENLRKTAVPQSDQVQTNLNNLAAQFETSFEQFLNRLNIPSKRDIDELSAKIAQLALRVEELRRTQETPTRNRTRGEAKEESAGE
jgi:poly(hydroxyalkanoate) granule-associated protein